MDACPLGASCRIFRTQHEKFCMGLFIASQMGRGNTVSFYYIIIVHKNLELHLKVGGKVVEVFIVVCSI